MKIGVVLNHVENSDTGHIPTYSDIRAIAQVAEANYLDSVWVFDHLLFRFEPEQTTGIWECWTLLAALAEATDRVELGTLVLCNPFRNPALLAKMAHTLDEVSHGRLILGVGAGWHQPEFDAFGYSFERRVGRFEEAMQIMQPLLKGQTVDFAGEHYQAENCVITPLGPRGDELPLLVASFSPRMMRLTAQYADQWNTAWLGNASELGERLTKIQAACEKAGRDPQSLTVTVGVSVAFPELGETSPYTENPMTGTPAEIAASLAEFEAAGADHLIVQTSPATAAAVEQLGAAIKHYRDNKDA